MKKGLLRALIICGIIIPVSQLARTYFGLPIGGFVGFILPTLAALVIVCVIVYSFLAHHNAP